VSGAPDRRANWSESRQKGNRAGGQPGRTGNHQDRARLLEREAHLSELRVLLSGSWDRPVGPVVVEGRTGFGKTALLGAACQIAADAGYAVLRARADDSCKDVLRSLSEQLLDSFPLEVAPERGHETPPADAVTEIGRRVRHLALGGGVLVAVDDAQWLDDESAQLLRSLRKTGGRRRPRLIMSVAPRSVQSPLRPVDSLMSEPGVRVMSLAPLSCLAVGSLVEECLGQYCDEPAREAFARACHEATDGIPALLFYLLRELATRHVPATLGSVGCVERATSRMLARSVLERLSRLPHDATWVLEVVAVAKEAADLELIAAVTRLSSARVSARARLLAAADLLRLDSDRLRMTPIVRRTVYEETDAKQRAKVHLAVAANLKLRGASFDRIAEHLVVTAPGHNEWVERELLEASHIASVRGDDARALRYLRRAFAEQPKAWGDPALLLELARAEMHVDLRAAVEHLLRSVERGVEPRRGAAVAHQLTLRLEQADVPAVSYSETKEALGSVLERIAALLSETEVSERLELRISGALAAGSQRALVATESMRRDFDVSRPRTQAEHKAVALFTIADSVSPRRMRPGDIADVLRQILLDAQLCNEDPIDCQLWARTLLSLARTGEFALADQFARHAQDMSASRGLLAAQAEYSLTLAMSLTMQGSIVEASSHVLNSLSVADGRGWSRRPDAVACLVAKLIDRGRCDEAETVLSRFSGLEQEMSAFEGPCLLEQRGRLRGCQGRSTEALSDLLEAGGRADACGVDSPVVTAWRSEAALLLAKEGRGEEAAPMAEANLELARMHGANWVVGPALRVAALAGAEERRLERLEEAVRLLDGSPARLQLAIALMDYGHALRRAGQPLCLVREALRSGLDIAFCQGSEPLISRALTELKLSGARPRRAAISGPGSLTSGERRVVALAADGLTNSDIARTLVLAEKTVEGHLVRAYRKLGVRSRRDLKALLQHSKDQAQTLSPGPSSSGAGLSISSLLPTLGTVTHAPDALSRGEFHTVPEEQSPTSDPRRRGRPASGKGV